MLVTANLRHLAYCEETVMTLNNIYSQMEIAPRQLAERYAEYPGGSHDQLYYPYEPAPGPHVPVVTKHHYSGGGHKNNAAMSALTLLAFLFFLHILQQCLKDHMTAMGTPQVMIMTGGRDGEENIAKASHKVDKTGVTDYEKVDKHTYKNSSIYDEDKYLMKITTSENAPWRTTKNQNVFKNYINRSSTFGSHPMDGH